jgi:general L-amino acid transport system substrate-binding protein
MAGRIDAIRDRGHLTCGISAGIAGFAEFDSAGKARGFDVDICRAVATAILGDPDRIRLVQVDTVTQMATMPDLDLVIRRLTWTLTREASTGLLFGPIVFHDGQGFLVPASAAVENLQDLEGKGICVDPGEDWARNLRRQAGAARLHIDVVVTRGPSDSAKRLLSGECAAYSADKSMLGAIRASDAMLADYRIPAAEISKEPLAPLVRQGDDSFFLVVRWTILALIEAEELGVTSGNVDEMRDSTNPDIGRLLGRAPGNGKALGLDEDWAYRVIKAIGNYGEMFDRDLGANSPVRLDRGLDRLWTAGGLMYAPPVQ